MSINNFKSSVLRHGGVQRKYRWRINPSFPAGLVSSGESRDLSALATTTNTPKSTLGEIPVMYGGREFPFPGDRKYEAIPITFINVEDLFHHDVLETWSQLFNGDNSNNMSGNIQDLFQDWTLDMLDKNDNVVKTYRLEDCWPQEVGELELDQASQDEVSQFTFMLRFFRSTNPNSL